MRVEDDVGRMDGRDSRLCGVEAAIVEGTWKRRLSGERQAPPGSFSASSLVIECVQRVPQRSTPPSARVFNFDRSPPVFGSLKFNRGFALDPRSKEVKG